MSHTWSCCNCDPSDGCVWGWRIPQTDDESLCLHTTGQELYLNIPRPAYSFAWNWFQLTDLSLPCACTGIDFGYGITASEKPDIEGKYSHWDGDDSGSDQAGTDFPWFYDHGGAVGTANIEPGNLWPTATYLCCGYDLGPSGFDDYDCANDSPPYTASPPCSTYRWTRDGVGNPRLCTRHQQEIIDTGTSPKIDPSNTNIMDCNYYGDAFKWLGKISANDDSEQFRHWYWDTGTAAVQQYDSGAYSSYLAETLLAVFHQEIWWENYYNSLYEEDPGNPSTCRMMSHAAFGCGGIPIFTWEIADVHYAALAAEMTDDPLKIIENVSLGLPLTVEMKNAMMSVGLLELGDWGQDDGEPIKKTVKYHDGRRVTSETRYYFARPGGWNLICPGATNESPPTLERWPQVARNSSTYSPSCESILDWMGWACFSAAPFPNDTEYCYNAGGTCGIYNACSTVLPTNCNYGTTVNGRFNVDQWSADCQGILFRYSVYCNKSLAYGTDPWECCLENDATLCVVAPGSTQCKLDLEELTSNLWHWIPEEVSESFRDGTGTVSGDLCCGGDGVFEYSGINCPAPTPQAQGCSY